MRKGFPANFERLEIEGFFGKGMAHTIEPSVFN